LRPPTLFYLTARLTPVLAARARQWLAAPVLASAHAASRPWRSSVSISSRYRTTWSSRLERRQGRGKAVDWFGAKNTTAGDAIHYSPLPNGFRMAITSGVWRTEW